MHSNSDSGILRRSQDLAEVTTTAKAPMTQHVQAASESKYNSTATEQVFTRGQRWQYIGLVALWVAVNIRFWFWWLRPSHVGNPVIYSILTAAIFYWITVVRSFYLFFLGWMRRPQKATIASLQAGTVGRVAVITLTVPGSESLEIVRRQLDAMANITYPHDSWILVDKEHSPEIEAMSIEFGVRYFCRHDAQRWGTQKVARWNAAGPPFQTATKAGNVNAWLDEYGEEYSHFTQLDIDHVPVPGYLEAVLGYFQNPRVAWVQAPSVYGNHQHWTARGSTEQEFVLQGPLQMGFFGFSRTPFIIGSHSTYDMKAIRSIGGFQPTRAEDHLDTVCLAAAGREGVYLPEVIAVGDGPETFDTYLAQQFAWAYSMIRVLLSYTPRLLPRYTIRQATQFLFAQTWYTFWCLSAVALFLTPVLSLTLDAPISTVSILEYVIHSWPIAVVALGTYVWSRRWHQPRWAILSWRGVVLDVARWITVFIALVQVLLRVRKPYMITRKSLASVATSACRFAVIRPYLALVAIALGACWYYFVFIGTSSSQGMLFYALLEVGLLVVMLAVVAIQEIRSLIAAGISFIDSLRMRVVPLTLLTTMAALIATTASLAAHPIWVAWTAQ